MGLFVCFSGMDGTGKTTLAQFVAETLIEWDWSTVQIWTPDFFVIRYPIALIRHLRRGTNDSMGNPSLTPGSKPKPLRLFPYLALLDNWAFYWVQIKPHLIQGQVVVCDRYFYNFFLSFEYYGYASARTTAFCTCHLPRPDLSFVLDCEPEIAWRRERDGLHNLAFFQAQRERYRSLARRLQFDLIDTNQALERTAEQIRARLAEELCDGPK